MRFLAKGQANAPPNPPLDLWVQSDGILQDPYSLEFQIWDVTGTPNQVFPLSGRQAVDLVVNKIGLGRFYAEYTVDPGANKGLHEIRWFLKLTDASDEVSFSFEFDVIESVVTLPFPRVYALLSDARAEGITDAQAGDSRVLRALAMASAQIESVTGRSFGPAGKTVFADGRGSPDLLLAEPIIALEGIDILSHAFGAETSILVTELADVAIYNRHLRGLTDPDDRDNPKVSFFRFYDHLGDHYRETRPLYPHYIFDFGQQNVRLTGVFGYTDPNGSPTGDVPFMLRRACVLLASRVVDPALSAAANVPVPVGPIKSEKTRDQEVTYAAPKELGGASYGPFTGDPAIDNILIMYSRTARLGAA